MDEPSPKRFCTGDLYASVPSSSNGNTMVSCSSSSGNPVKTLAIFFDGTTNNHFDIPDSWPTNVFKLFHALDGVCHAFRKTDSPKTRQEIDGSTFKAYYLTGIASDEAWYQSPLSAISGLGIIPRVARAWMWFSRWYQSGMKVILVGFSRGSFIATVFTQLLLAHGIIPHYSTEMKRIHSENSDPISAEKDQLKCRVYQEAVIVILQWYLSREATTQPVPKAELNRALGSDYLTRRKGEQFLNELYRNWPYSLSEQQAYLHSYYEQVVRPDTSTDVPGIPTGVFDSLRLSTISPTPCFLAKDLILAVWDNVPAVGEVMVDPAGRHIVQHTDMYPGVDFGAEKDDITIFHAIAQEEGRVNFSPRLFCNGSRVTQMLFPGCHADVGGGYPCLTTDKRRNTELKAAHAHLKYHNCGRAEFFKSDDHHHESALSDISLAWMMFNLNPFLPFKQPLREFAEKVEQGQEARAQLGITPSSGDSRELMREQSLWLHTIELCASPNGLAHLEGSLPFPRHYPEDIKISEHRSIDQRGSDGTNRQYYLHTLGLTPFSPKYIVSHRYLPAKFRTRLTHIFQNEHSEAPCLSHCNLLVHM